MSTYVVHGGHVRSADGDTHYISPSRTAELYGLDPVTSIYFYGYESLRGYDREFLESAVHVYPDSSGKYELPPLVAPAQPGNKQGQSK